PEPLGSHKRPRREPSPSSSSNGEDGDDGGNYIQESGKDSTHPNRLGLSIDPEIDRLDQLFHSNQSGLMPWATSSTAPAMTTKDDPLMDLLRKLRIQTKLDDKQYQDAITILNMPGAAMTYEPPSDAVKDSAAPPQKPTLEPTPLQHSKSSSSVTE
ncbi:hypothetical protein PTTG_30525, partial [Puccinia triticina 1-1 BBBD Race 1]